MYTESPSSFELVSLKIFLSYGNLKMFLKHESNKNDTQHLHLSLSFMFKFSIHEPT